MFPPINFHIALDHNAVLLVGLMRPNLVVGHLDQKITMSLVVLLLLKFRLALSLLPDFIHSFPRCHTINLGSSTQ